MAEGNAKPPRLRDEWRWLCWHRLGSVSAIEAVFGPVSDELGKENLPILAREKRALEALLHDINEREAQLIIEEQKRQRR